MLVSLRAAFEEFLRHWFGDRYPSPFIYGFVTGGSALKNAAVHAGRRFLLHVDVRDFFPSTTAATVRDALLRLGLHSKGAELLASVVTRKGALPLGYPTSPLFSNLVLVDVDERLGRIASRTGATYSRYADDITFSSDGALPTRAEVADVLQTVGLSVHPTKSRTKKRGQALYVTGYSVSDAAPRAPRPLKRRLRQELHYVNRHGLLGHVDHIGRASVVAEFDRIVGQIQHVRHAEPVAGARLMAEWSRRPTHLDGDITRHAPGRSTPVALYFDDSTFTFFGTGYRALGSVVLRDVDTARSRIEEAVADLMLSRIMPEHAREHVRAEGLHFNKLPPDFRRDAVEVVATLPARAHVLFDEAKDSKKVQLKAFLVAALRLRLAECRGRLVTVIFEKGEYIRPTEAEALVADVVARLPAEAKPLRIDGVRVVGKLEDPCVALPDIFLGAWQQFACDHEEERKKNRNRDELLFRILQRQIGTIYRPSTKELFTSKRPFDGLEPPPRVAAPPSA